MKSKNIFPVRGYVRPYEAQSRWALAVITFSGITAMLIYLLCKIPDLYGVNMSQPHYNDMEKIYRATVEAGIPLLGFSGERSRTQR